MSLGNSYMSSTYSVPLDVALVPISLCNPVLYLVTIS
jgi:hypothetical protein